MLPSSVIPWKMCTWMIKTKLKLNDDTTELIVISSKHQPRPAIESIQVGEENINYVPTVRNLGVLFSPMMISANCANVVSLHTFSALLFLYNSFVLIQ